jgi:hypothetical protein
VRESSIGSTLDCLCGLYGVHFQLFDFVFIIALYKCLGGYSDIPLWNSFILCGRRHIVHGHIYCTFTVTFV